MSTKHLAINGNTVPAVNPVTCQECGSSARVALHGGRWLCVKCHPSLPCPKCGAMCKPIGVGRFGLLKAENNAEYDLDQEMGFRCMGAHDWQVREKTSGTAFLGSLFFGPVHKGPGALLSEAKR